MTDKLNTPKTADVEGHSARANFAPAEQPADVEGHGGYRPGPAEQPADVEGHGCKWSGRVTFAPARDVEGHAFTLIDEAGQQLTIQVASITLERADGDPVVLDTAGPEVEGHPWRPWGAPVADVEGHAGKWGAPASDVEGHKAPAEVRFTRMAIVPAAGGEPIVLEPAGTAPGGELTYQVIAGLADVEGHTFRH